MDEYEAVCSNLKIIECVVIAVDSLCGILIGMIANK